jgi:hypothetical protein
MPHLDAGHGTSQFNHDHVYLVTMNREKAPPRTESYLTILGEASKAKTEQLAGAQSDVDIEYEKSQRRNARQGLGPFKDQEAKDKWAADMAKRYVAITKQVERESRQAKKGQPDPKLTFLADYDYEMEVDSLDHFVKWNSSAGEESMMGHTELSEEQIYQKKIEAQKKLEKAMKPDPRKLSVLKHQETTKGMSSSGARKHYARRAKMKGLEKEKMREARELEQIYVAERHKWQSLRDNSDDRKRVMLEQKRKEIADARIAAAGGPVKKDLLAGLGNDARNRVTQHGGGF